MVKTAWHPAFFRALEIELEDFADYLEFYPEYELAKEPLRLDVMVIKKNIDLQIEKKIGRIFKKHNLAEYKSPSDYISIDDYHKVLSYAHLYKAITGNTNEVTTGEIAITFACNHYPTSLFEYLRKQFSYEIIAKWPGIYYCNDQIFATQILVRDELPLEENFYLKCLIDDLERDLLINALHENARHQKEPKYEEYFTTIYDANFELLLEVFTMVTMTPELMEKLEKTIVSTGLSEKLKAEGIVEAQIEIAISLLDVLNDDLIAKKTKLPLQTIKKLRQNNT